MSEDQRTWTLDDSARASNPGGLRVNPIRWISYYPKWPMIWFFSFVFFLLLAWFAHGFFWIFAILLLAMNWFYWRRVRDHFMYGCANPAIVVSLQPMLIAVVTDLSKGIGKYPAIKIIEKSMSTVCGQPPRIGARLPAIALYSRGIDSDSPHWADFDPRPIDCATGDQRAMFAVMNRFTEDEWNEFRAWYRQVPRPIRCGLFLIETT